MDEIYTIKLSNCEEETIVDKEIYDLLKDKNLWINSNSYVHFSENDKTIRLKRFVYKYFNPKQDIKDIIEIE